jgi:hypothetical protein
MTEFVVKLAETPVLLKTLFPETAAFLRDYWSSETPRFALEMREEDLERERILDARGRAAEGKAPLQADPQGLERLALCRKLSETLLSEGVLLFHGSAVALDGEAYLFAAPSGVGKSTHARLWRQLWGDRLHMVNDDKPFLRVTSAGVWVCGSPWDGKHRLSENLCVPLRGICFLEQAEKNEASPLTAAEAFPRLYAQTHRPPEPEKLQKVLSLLASLSGRVKLVQLRCNRDPEAARLSYQSMREDTV